MGGATEVGGVTAWTFGNRFGVSLVQACDEGRLLEGARDRMNAWAKLRLATATLAALVGALCLAAVGYWLVGYVRGPPNWDSIRYLVEAVRWSVLSVPPFALSAILALTVRRFISRKLLWLLSLPVFAAGLLILNIALFLSRVMFCG